MQQRSIVVPGKLMLSGEYAVLDGAPAVMACVDREVRVTGVFGDADEGRLRILADTESDWRWRWCENKPEWVEADPPRLIDVLMRAFPSPELVSLSVDSQALFDRQRKLGLGSSAAVAVAVGAMLAGDLQPTTIARIAAAHREFQGGVGSGADTHAVAQGGVVRFEPGEQFRPMVWPTGLHIQPVVAPRSVSTPGRIGRFRQWQQSNDRSAAMVQLLTRLALEIAENWMKARTSGIIDGMRSYLDTMREVSAAADLGYLQGGHAQLLPLADACGVVYKPCGAGGGDVGFAMANDPEALRRFGEQALDQGFSVPNWRVGYAKPSGDGVMGADE
ncbi:MAG: hypothetical protein AAGL69_01595 [Pseudomonadota bacterium]